MLFEGATNVAYLCHKLHLNVLLEVGSDRITEIPELADLTYAHTLVIKSTYEYKVHGPYGSNLTWT